MDLTFTHMETPPMTKLEAVFRGNAATQPVMRETLDKKVLIIDLSVAC